MPVTNHIGATPIPSGKKFCMGRRTSSTGIAELMAAKIIGHRGIDLEALNHRVQLALTSSSSAACFKTDSSSP